MLWAWGCLLQGVCLLFVEHESYFMTLTECGSGGIQAERAEQGCFCQLGLWVRISLTVLASTASSSLSSLLVGFR